MKKILALLATITAAVSMEAPEDSRWQFKERHGGGDFEHMVIAENHSGKGYVDYVVLKMSSNYKSIKEKFSISIALTAKNTSERGRASYAALRKQGNFAQEIEPLGLFVPDVSWTFKSFFGKESLALECFYKYNQIPDVVIDRLLHVSQWPDFRLTGPKILELVDKERGEDTSAETSQRLILHYLNQISDLRGKSEAAASIIQAIDEVHEELIWQLAKFVTDSSVTGYEQVKSILSRIQLNKKSEDYLLPLLRVTTPTAQSQEQLNLFIRRSYLGMSGTELPKALQNVQVTPEGTLRLLKLIFEQKRVLVILSRIQLYKESEEYLLPLLKEIEPTAESQEQLDLFIRQAYLGMGETELPEALQNVQITPEGTLRLLKLIFEQKKIIDSLT